VDPAGGPPSVGGAKMELRQLIEKHESLEIRARDMIRDKLAIVLSELQNTNDFDALPPIIEP
jgi:hypothetical protein